MARDNITDKSSPPKSEWFGYKYRVTPETSKLLQEAVFKDGGKWSSSGIKFFETDDTYIFVQADGIMTLSSCFGDFQDDFLPEKQPPQPPKYESEYGPDTAQPAGYTAYVVFKQDLTEGALKKGEYGGKAYAYICSREDYTQWVGYRAFDEDVFAVVKVSGVGKEVKVLRIEAKVDPKATKSIVRILPNSVDTNVKESKIIHTVTGYGLDAVALKSHIHLGNKSGNIATTDVGDTNMSNVNRVVSVKFFDDDAGLKAEYSLVAEYQVTTRVSDQMTISKVLLTEDVAGDIKLHNEVRAATVDLHILKQTGNKVMLQPIKFEDLRVEVRQV
jgi:hypothetical protein